MSSIDGFIAETKYEAGFDLLLAHGHSYSSALKELINKIGDLQSNNCITFVADKILNKRNDNVFSFFGELQAIESSGYKFNSALVNFLMEDCLRNYNMNYHHFIQTRIVNKLTTTELNQLNEKVLIRFVDERMRHVKQQRCLGLSRPPSKKANSTKNDK